MYDILKMAIPASGAETSFAHTSRLATPALAVRRPSVVTLVMSRPTLTSTTTITLGNDEPGATTLPPLAATSTSATPEPAPAGGSGGISTTGVVILGLVLGLSCLALLLCFLCRNRCRDRETSSPPRSLKGHPRRPPPKRCGFRGPPGPRGPQGIPGLRGEPGVQGALGRKSTLNMDIFSIGHTYLSILPISSR